jgi:hypothetical protein
VRARRGGGSDVRRRAFLNGSREFAGRVPVVPKAGVDVRVAERDARGGTINYTYARLRNVTDFHSLWTFGVKGSY